MDADESRPGSPRSLRRLVRELVASSRIPTYQTCDAWVRGHDPEFTKLLADNRLIGMTWPRHLGGRAASNLERLVVTEELLRVGAPVAAHWIADRQIGPAILQHGSEKLQREYLPRIAAGEVSFCLGMSESESGSDLAALRTKAVRDGDSFTITGRKIWTSNAHHATHAYALARTGGGEDRHEGLTEFVVDMSSPGVEVRPIHDLTGEHHFNEMIFEDVVVPADQVIGAVGDGWRQVTQQLAYERGGPERVLSTYPLLAAVLAGAGAGTDGIGETAYDTADIDRAGLGDLVARLHTLRAMAAGVARSMDADGAPVQRAALLKYLGTAFERDVVEYVRDALGRSPDPAADGIEGLLGNGILVSPGATIRGGTTEVLLTIVGRQVLSAGSSARRSGGPADELRGVVDEVLSAQEPDDAGGGLGPVWGTAVELGWTGIGVPESAGGSGGDVSDLSVIAASLAHHAHSAPVVDTALAGRILADAGRVVDGTRPRAMALGEGVVLSERDGDLVLDGRQPRVPWARYAESLVVAASGPAGDVLVDLRADARGVTISPGGNLAGEPRDTVVLDGVTVPAGAVVGDRDDVGTARTLADLLRAAAIRGALESAVDLARDHVTVREQFGRPLARFQAVAHTLARMAAELASVQVAVEEGLAEVEAGGRGWRTVAARVVAGRAATAVARDAHQMLGAIGITREHDLHRRTLRLWAWRDDGEPARTLARRLGETALAAGRDATWDWCVQEADLQ